MHEPMSKAPAPVGAKFYLKHLAIAFGVGIGILAVTYIGLAVIYGPFVPFQTHLVKPAIRPQPNLR